MEKLTTYLHYALKYLTVYHYHAQDGFIHTSYGREQHALVYIEHGQAEFREADSTITLHEGDWGYIPEGLRYSTHWHGTEISYYTVDFSFEKTMILQDVPRVSVVSLGKEQYAEHVVLAASNHSMMEVLLKEMENSFCSADPADNVLAAADFYRMWHYVLLGKSQGMQDDVASRARAIIERDPVQELSVECLCRELCVSKTMLYTYFKKKVGMTPIRYRNHLLMRIGRELLAGGKHSVADVSEMLNLNSPDYFTVLYKQEFGRSPREDRG